MGCDIHGVIQVKKKNKWVTVAEGYPFRNYRAFAILANVRNELEFDGTASAVGFQSIDNPRGIPSDFEIHEEHHPLPKNFKWYPQSWRVDAYDDHVYWMGTHSYSYVTAKDLLEVDWLNPVYHSVGQAFLCFVILMQQYALENGGLENVRFVFGFDN